MRIRFYILALVIAASAAFFPHIYASAQATSGDVFERRAALERELATLEEEIEAQRKILADQQRQTATLERDVSIINAKVQSAELSIRARRLEIQKLGNEISNKAGTITELNAKIKREKDSLGQLLRKTNEIDNYSLVEVVLANENISEFFKDLDSFDSIKLGLKESFVEVEETKNQTQAEKSNLEERQREEEELKKIQELQKKRIEEDKKEKDRILAVTKGKEELYQKIVQSKERDAAVIRTELFTLQGTDAIPFEKALELANLASEKTGVRPAFILGIIAEESNLGQNVGKGTWKVDMHPDRDRPIFAEITRKLGLNPDKMPVSKKPWYGWGGAMGPAQFIPSTWVLYEAKIAKLTGHNPPNPWDPYDAFMASGLLLKENGAAKGGYAAERLAALRYLAGWKNATKPAYAFYGDDVMALAEKYQNLITILAQN
ncbi:MAG TPA: hypothetical protein VJB70_04175 [Candidatus Paceibacterota bacterium]